MSSYDGRNAEVLVFTFKEGPLSTVAYDLKLRVETFSVKAVGAGFQADFDASSFKVVCSMADGKPTPGGLMASLYPDVLRNIKNSVLKVEKFPKITFETTIVSPTEIVGKLTLCGVTKEVTGKRSLDGHFRVGDFTIDQRDFGITPFSAMLGAMRIRAKINVQVRLPF